MSITLEAGFCNRRCGRATAGRHSALCDARLQRVERLAGLLGRATAAVGDATFQNPPLEGTSENRADLGVGLPLLEHPLVQRLGERVRIAFGRGGLRVCPGR